MASHTLIDLLPDNSDEHLITVPILSLRPHSTFLARESLEEVARLLNTGEGIVPPVIAEFDGYSLILDGDHRTHQLYLYGEEYLRVASYDLSQESDLVSILHFERARQNLSVDDSEMLLRDLRRIIAFLDDFGIKNTAFFQENNNYLPLRTDIDVAYEVAFSDFLSQNPEWVHFFPK